MVPPFVGRREELVWLESVLQEVLAGQPRVVLVLGEAGIGKTRLLHEMRSDILRRGLQIGYGRCYEDLTLPYLPFVEVLSSLLDPLARDLEHISGNDTEVLRWLLHRDQPSGRVANPFISTQSDQDKLRLFLAVSRIAVALVQRSPTVIAIEDLHWADRSSVDLFGHLIFTVADMTMRESMPLLIIGSYRPVDGETHLGRLIARLQRELICRTFTLPGLNEAEIHELVQGLGLLRPSHQLIATVSGATQGNPLFIQEVLHHLVQQDALQERSGYIVTTAAPADLRLPDQVTAAIVRRTQGLSEECRRILTLASFLGDRFSLHALATVSAMEEDTVLSLLEEGIRQRLLLSEGEAFRFVHSLIRHVFYHGPIQARQQRIHQQIAETLERLYGASIDAHILEIAHHLIRAGSTADTNSVVTYAWQAGNESFALFAWGEAARYYEAALLAAESKGQLSVQEQADLHYWAGLSHYRDQDVGPCLDHYEKAIEAYRLAGDTPGLGRALMEKMRTHNTFASVPYGTLIGMKPLEEVLDVLDASESKLRGDILAVMSEVYRTARQTDKAEEMARRAMEVGQRLQDDRLCAYASFARGLAQVQSLHVGETLESWQTALVHARRTDDLFLQGWPLYRMPNILIMLGRLDEAETVALEACALTRLSQDWGGYAIVLSALASVAAARGDFDAVERYAYETLLMVSRSRSPWGGFRSLAALAYVRTLRGVWTEAEDALDLLVEPGRIFQEAGPVIQAFVRPFRQLLRAYSGIVTDVMAAFAEDVVKTVSIDSYALAPLCALVELGDLLAAPTLAEPPYRVLSLAAEQGVLFTNGWVCLLPRILGIASALHCRWDTAEAYFQTALNVATRVGAQTEQGLTCLDFAHMLAVRHRTDDRQRAIELVQQADQIFRKLGMAPWALRALQLAETLQAHSALIPYPSPVLPGHLSMQEVEVLLQIAHGHTDQEIANKLVLNPSTISHYMSSLFTKIGVNSRAAAVAYAFEQGLASQISPHTQARTPGMGQLQAPLIILVTDLEGSTTLLQRLGDVQAHELIRLHNAIIRENLRAYRGFEVTHTGDGIEASFLAASNAVECAVAIQQAFAKYSEGHPNSPMRVRIGINAGKPIPTEGRLFGTAVHTAFHICNRARPGQILVSDVVYQLATDTSVVFINRGRIALKGLPERFRLYEVQW
jgi:class 3 adenylate cyclase/tetratricopeptide (TPR) repeat protein